MALRSPAAMNTHVLELKLCTHLPPLLTSTEMSSTIFNIYPSMLYTHSVHHIQLQFPFNVSGADSWQCTIFKPVYSAILSMNKHTYVSPLLYLDYVIGPCMRTSGTSMSMYHSSDHLQEHIITLDHSIGLFI